MESSERQDATGRVAATRAIWDARAVFRDVRMMAGNALPPRSDRTDR